MLYENLLKILSRVTKTDLGYLTKGSFWLTANQVSTLFLTFFLAVVFAHFLPTEVYGNYKFVLSLVAIVGALSLTGLNTAIVRDVARGVSGLLTLGFKTQLLWSIGTLAAAFCVSGYYILKGNENLAIAAALMGIATPLISSLRTYIPFLEGRQDFRRIAIFNTISTSIYVLTLSVVAAMTTDLVTIIFFYFVTQLLCSIIFFRISLHLDAGDLTKKFEKTITFAKDISILNVLTILAAQIDKILVFKYLGATQLAIYAFSQVPVGHVRTFLRQTTQLAFPKYSEKSMEEIKTSIYRKMLIFTFATVVVVGIYILLAPLFFKIFFPKYLDAIVYSQISMLSLLFLQKKLISYAALAHASRKKIYTMSLSASVFKIGLLMILIPQYGIWGAIYTEIIAQFIGLIASLVLLKKL